MQFQSLGLKKLSHGHNDCKIIVFEIAKKGQKALAYCFDWTGVSLCVAIDWTIKD